MEYAAKFTASESFPEEQHSHISMLVSNQYHRHTQKLSTVVYSTYESFVFAILGKSRGGTKYICLVLVLFKLEFYFYCVHYWAFGFFVADSQDKCIYIGLAL